MNSQKKRIQQLTLAAFFVAIEVIMSVTPIGYLPIGALSITTMHLPVILAGIMMGPVFGGEIGLVFGLTSFLKATFHPGITSFVFTPFVQIGTMNGNFCSLLIAFVPRILLGVLSGVLYNVLLQRTNKQAFSVMFTAGITTIIHTLLVLGGIWLFFGEQYAQALQISTSALMTVFIATISTNGILETALAVIVIPVLVKALSPTTERMGFRHAK